MPASFAAQPRSERVNARAVVSLLAPTLGWEKSEETVAGAMKLLELPEHFTVDQASAILDVLSKVPGIVGVTARFARSRADFARAVAPASSAGADPPARRPARSGVSGPISSVRAPVPRAPDSSGGPPSSSNAPESSARASHTSGAAAKLTMPIEEVASLLAHTIGQEKSREAVRASAKRVGIAEDRVDREQAALLLDDLAKQDGIVGITARFGKARLILRFGG